MPTRSIAFWGWLFERGNDARAQKEGGCDSGVVVVVVEETTLWWARVVFYKRLEPARVGGTLN
jgi:hypothetical protein